jgi:hypothetical protein
VDDVAPELEAAYTEAYRRLVMKAAGWQPRVRRRGGSLSKFAARDRLVDLGIAAAHREVVRQCAECLGGSSRAQQGGGEEQGGRSRPAR